MTKMISLLFVVSLLTSSCVHIETRCIDAGLPIQKLVIEDTGTFTSHAKVRCGKG